MVSADVATELDRQRWRSCERVGKPRWSRDAGELSVAADSGLLRGVVDVYDGRRRWGAAFDDPGDCKCGAGWIDEGLCDLKTGS